MDLILLIKIKFWSSMSFVYSIYLSTNAPTLFWLPLPSYSLSFHLLLTGFTEINLTKLDVLSGFPEVKIGRKYMLNGQEVKGMPSSLKEYSDIKVDFEVMPGWTEDVSNIKNFKDLPVNCQAYVLRLEELIGVPIRWWFIGIMWY